MKVWASKQRNEYQQTIGIMVWLAMMLMQGTTVLLAQEQGDTIRINPRFADELEKAFSLDFIEAPIEPKDEVLTREQLREWVGPVEGALREIARGKYDPTDPNRFDSTYFALKMYLVDFCKWQPVSTRIAIPGLGNLTDGVQHYGNNWHSLRTGGMAKTIDVNALAQYIRPSQIRLRKSRELADKSRAMMDKFFPTEGAPLYTISDTLALWNRQKDKE